MKEHVTNSVYKRAIFDGYGIAHWWIRDIDDRRINLHVQVQNEIMSIR